MSSRPRRAAAQTASLMMDLQKEDYGNTSTSLNGSAKNMHELVEPQRYYHEREQPAVLFISMEALFLMTVHTHMHRNEVIGFLSGY